MKNGLAKIHRFLGICECKKGFKKKKTVVEKYAMFARNIKYAMFVLLHN